MTFALGGFWGVLFGALRFDDGVAGENIIAEKTRGDGSDAVEKG
jgi:hypothetical protein